MRLTRGVLLSLFLIMAFFGSSAYANAKEIEFTQAEREFIQKHPVIRLGVDPMFVPYELLDSDGQYKGIAADYLKLISARTGLQFEVEKDLTWSQAYEQAVERKLDALPCIAKTREREQHFLFSEPYYSFQRVIIAKESDDTVNGFEDLYYHTVALKENSSHHSYIKSFPAIKISPYPSEEAALKAVADGREKYFVGNLANSSYQIKTNGFTNLKMIQINTEEKQYLHFAARNDWPELVGIVNKGLASITEAEKIEINNRWIGIENKPDYGEIIKIITIITAILLGIFLISLYWIIKLRREVAERIKVEEALKIAKEEAEVANHIKSTFLARMSHEIRTPLNAITGMTYLIRKTDITVTQKIYLDKITQASRNMLGIINDILDFSKIEAGKIEVERVPFNLDKVLQQVINIVSYKIDEQGIDFIITKDPGIPAHFFGDPTRLEQILLNVINNAVKFTAEGEVAVAVRMISRENNMIQLEFSIKDTGIGMSREQLDNLFKPFDQGDSSINRRFGGTGLGLSIVKSLVDLLGGEISVESILGEGSIFRIRLAYELDPDRENEDKQKSASVCLKKIRVLILEKNATSSNLLKEYLNSFGMQADFSVTEEEAVKMLKETGRYKQPYDLFILDNDTPESGGIEFASRIKNDRQIVVKPRIMLMIPLMREDLFERIEEADVDFGISKPIIASILYNSIIEVFKDQVLAGHDQPSQDEPVPNLLVDYPYHVLIIEDNKTNQFIARSILEQSGFKVSLADNGKTGFEFFVQHQDDLDLILMDLHMPVMNGYESAGLIRTVSDSLPIVAMTADAIAGVEEQCRSVGINHYISKPFEPEQFVATIWNVIKTLPEKQAKAGKNETTRVIDNAVAVLDENEGIRCLGNNRELYLMVLNEYYQENKEVLTILTNKINEKQYPDAVQIVHKIKSSTGNIGAKRLFAVASELQKSLVNENEPEVFKLLDQFKIEYHQLVDAIIARI